MLEQPSLDYRERFKRSIKWWLLWVAAIVVFKPALADAGATAWMQALKASPPLWLAVYRILFGSSQDFFESIRFSWTPDLLSAFFGELLQDWRASAKLFLLGAGVAAGTWSVAMLYGAR